MVKNNMGVRGEDAAVEYLKDKGYTVLNRNFHSRFGEIDIIAKIKNIICFVEVKTRKNNCYGRPAEAVNYSKRQKIIQTAEQYLSCNFSENFMYRFDIIEVFYYDSYIFSFNHLKGAFEV